MELPLRSPSFPRPVFGLLVRFVVAPVVLFFTGFFSTDFILSGVYTWPRASRFFTITLGAIILSYEFVYKNTPLSPAKGVGLPNLKGVLYFCIVPYILGSLALMGLVVLSS